MANSSVLPGIALDGVYLTPGGIRLTCVRIDEDTVWFRVNDTVAEVEVDLSLWVAVSILTPLSEPNYEGSKAA